MPNTQGTTGPSGPPKAASPHILPSYTPVITSVSPAVVPRGKSPVTFTVTGNNLSHVDKILVSGQHGWWSGATSEGLIQNLTDTGFTFTATPTDIGLYNLFAYDSGIAIAQKMDAFRVTLGGGISIPMIIQVTPNPVAPNLTITYTVVGTLLGTTDGVYWEGPNPGSAAVSNVTDSGFSFTATLTTEGFYNVVATTGGNDLARKNSAIYVGVGAPTGPTGPTQPVPDLISVTPTFAIKDAPEDYAAVGTALETTDEISIEGPGGVVVAPTSVQADGTGFAFTATLTEIGVHQVIAFAAGAELDRWSAINVGLVTGLATITSVTPPVVDEDVSVDYVVLGTELGLVTGCVVEGPGGTGTLAVTNVTDGTFNFTATLSQPGVHNVVAVGANGEIARYDGAITVNDVLSAITSVTPTIALDDVSTDFSVIGTGLAQTTEAFLEGPGGTTVPATAITDTSFDFTAALTDPGNYNVIATGASGEIARKNAAIIVGTLVATITAVTPGLAQEDIVQTYTVTGTKLLPTDGVIIEGPGGGTTVPNPGSVTDTGFIFSANLTEPGLYNVIATAAGAPIARYDAAIEVSVTPTIVSVTPTQAVDEISESFTVLGTALDSTTSVTVEGPGGGSFVVANVTATGFTFDAALTELGLHNVIAADPNGEFARLDDAIDVVAPALATITSVNPTMAQDDTLTAFSAIGTGLEGTTGVTVEGPGGVQVVPLTVDPAGFGFTFEATLTDIGIYTVIATGAGGEIARRAAAITVGAVIGVITAVTPSQAYENAPQTYTVTGTGLATTDGVIVEGLGGVTVAPDAGSVTDTGFTFSATLTEIGAYNVIATEAGVAIARYDAAITVIAAVITSVNPTAAQVGDAVTYAVLGAGLTNVDGVTVEGAGGVAVPILATPVPTDTSFSFTATLTAEDVYDVIATIASAEHARLDAAITVAAVPVPIITSITPVVTTVNTATTFTATGEYLELTATVTLQNADILVAPITGIVPTSVDPAGLGFVFDATIPEPGPYTVIALDAAAAEIARWNAVLTVTPLGIITDVTPPVAPQSVITTFTATGLGLLPTDGVRLEGSGVVVDGVLVGTATDTTFDFTAVLDLPGDYDVIATTGSNPLAREDNAILVPTTSTILKVTPNAVPHDTLTSFLVEGLVLGAVTTVNLYSIHDPLSGQTRSQVVDVPVVPIDDYSFSFDAQLAGADIFSLYAYDATDVEVANKQGAISVSETTSVITLVDPPQAVVGVPTTFTVTGVDL